MSSSHADDLPCALALSIPRRPRSDPPSRSSLDGERSLSKPDDAAPAYSAGPGVGIPALRRLRARPESDALPLRTATCPAVDGTPLTTEGDAFSGDSTDPFSSTDSFDSLEASAASRSSAPPAYAMGASLVVTSSRCLAPGDLRGDAGTGARRLRDDAKSVHRETSTAVIVGEYLSGPMRSSPTPSYACTRPRGTGAGIMSRDAESGDGST